MTSAGWFSTRFAKANWTCDYLFIRMLSAGEPTLQRGPSGKQLDYQRLHQSLLNWQGNNFKNKKKKQKKTLWLIALCSTSGRVEVLFTKA